MDEVVDVRPEHRHLLHRRRRHPVGELAVGGGVPIGQLVELVEVGDDRAQRAPGGGTGIDSPARPNRGWTRLTTSPAGTTPVPPSLPTKNSASSTASGRGDVTTTYAVAGSARSARTAAARVRNPSSMPWNAWKNATASWTISAPATFEIVRSRACVATETARRYARVGMSTARNSRFSRNCVSRRGASRRSSALRVGGVSTTTTS